MNHQNYPEQNPRRLHSPLLDGYSNQNQYAYEDVKDPLSFKNSKKQKK